MMIWLMLLMEIIARLYWKRYVIVDFRDAVQIGQNVVSVC